MVLDCGTVSHTGETRMGSGVSGQGLEARGTVQDHSKRVHKRQQITDAEYVTANSLMHVNAPHAAWSVCME